MDRNSLLPKTKYTPEMDFWPPTIIDGWPQSVPLPYPVNTRGGEPTLSGGGKTLYFVHHYYSEDLSTMLEADIYVMRWMEP